MKYHVFFRRVSTDKQNMEMQQSADAYYREKLLPEEIKVIDEDALSANKKFINERPEMQKLISLIKEDQVDTLYAFDRTRLFRDYYEGIEFTDLCLKHDIQVIYTSEGNGNVQATKDIFLEGILAMFSDIEGKNIARRNIEASKRYPGRKLGYVKENKHYYKDPVKKELLEAYFSSLSKISTLDELALFLKKYRSIFKTNDETLIRIAQDPFYAGHDLSKGNYKLKHVEAYLSLKDFRAIQDSLGEVFNEYLKRLDDLESQKSYLPICGYCQKPLCYSKDKINNNSFFKCTTKSHPKVFISTIDLAKIIEMVISQIIIHLNSNKLLKHSLLQLRNIRKEINSQIQTIENQLNNLLETILLGEQNYTSNWKENNPQYQKLNALKIEKQRLLYKHGDGALASQ
ncbi:recombinase family protein [Ornithinibacillus halophilus]|uniref:Site-specific DNA recombinase n=1 Tax=Ornithinibacillus halophilus TaxID=930117 RepID=A0A1M5IPN4_9BACI|nr:recombinase family protein [Ornithinibacillus halophilus]SHG30186.1 Site-specific DNA recombinase [Ornithinibacillus halophilus]